MILETLTTIYMGLFSLMIAVGYIGAELFPPPTGHEGYVESLNLWVGSDVSYLQPYTYGAVGRFVLEDTDYVIFGSGLTHRSKDDQGKLRYHFFDQEILPGYENPAWVGKCLMYIVVNPDSHIIESWEFDEGGNPLSCRLWNYDTKHKDASTSTTTTATTITSTSTVTSTPTTTTLPLLPPSPPTPP